MAEQLNLDFKETFTDWYGKTCEICKGDEYREMSLYDDWDGKVTCPTCRHRRERLTRD